MSAFKGLAMAAASVLAASNFQADLAWPGAWPHPKRTFSPSYTKKGPGRRPQSGKPDRWPFKPGETAVSVSPERRVLYMHSAARRRFLAEDTAS